MTISKGTQYITNPSSIPVDTSTGLGQQISNAFDTRSVKYDTIADMISSSVTEGSLVGTSGYYTKGDGGDAIYSIVNQADYSGTPDEITDITLSTGDIAVLSVGSVISCKQAGCVDDVQITWDQISDTQSSTGTDSTANLWAAVDYLKRKGGGKLVFDGLFLSKDVIVPYHNQEWEGFGENTGIHFGDKADVDRSIRWVGNPPGFAPYSILPYFNELQDTAIRNFIIHDMYLGSNTKVSESIPDKTWGVSGIFQGLSMSRMHGGFFSYDYVDVFDGPGQGGDPSEFSDRVVIRECDVRYFGRHGLTCRGSKHFECRANTVRDYQLHGIDTEYDNVNQIGGKFIVKNNDVSGVGPGITYQGFANGPYDEIISIEGNTISSSSGGSSIDIDTKGSPPTNSATIDIKDNIGDGDIQCLGAGAVAKIQGNNTRKINASTMKKVDIVGGYISEIGSTSELISVSLCSDVTIGEGIYLDFSNVNADSAIDVSAGVSRLSINGVYLLNPLYDGFTKGVFSFSNSESGSVYKIHDNFIEDTRATAYSSQNLFHFVGAFPTKLSHSGNSYRFTNDVLNPSTGLADYDFSSESTDDRNDSEYVHACMFTESDSVASTATWTTTNQWRSGRYLVNTSSFVNQNGSSFGLYLMTVIGNNRYMSAIQADASLTVSINSSNQIVITNDDASFSRTVVYSVTSLGENR